MERREMPFNKNDLSAFARTSASLHHANDNYDRIKEDRKKKANVPSHEADDHVPPERVHETMPCPTYLQLEGILDGKEYRVR
jgi:hypothetical protein